MGVMEESEQQQPSIVLKHYCKVCKRGFGCAGALGGHMRSHGVGGDARVHHPSSNEDKSINDFNCSKPEGSKHSYFLRKANRFTSYRASEDHDKRPSSTRPGCNERGKCTMDEMVLPVSSSESEDEGIMKKSKRAKSGKYDDNYYASSEEEDLANCLVMLSNKSFVLSDKEENKAKELEKGMFQCKACKKVFSSHQALGGHRASHKKVKGCYAARFSNIIHEDDNVEDDMISHDKLFVPSDSSEPGFDLDLDHSAHLPTSTTSKRKSKEHECSICHRIFSSGQALGGHKRCHWLTGNLPDNTIIQNLHDQFQFESPPFFKKPMLRKPDNLDLNSPPLLNNAAVDHGNINSPSTPFNYEAPARIFLRLWGSEEVDNINHNQQEQQQHGQIMHDSLHDLNSDEECRVKLAKLSDLKDMKLDGVSPGWLQVGIASTTEMTATP